MVVCKSAGTVLLAGLLAVAVTKAAVACHSDLQPTEAKIAQLEKQRDCETRHGTQIDANACEADLYELSTALLAQAVGRVQALIEGEKEPVTVDYPRQHAQAFDRAQQAWCAARDANCDFDVDALGGGTMSGMVNSSCRRNRNLARVKALEALAKCLQENNCGRPLLLYPFELNLAGQR
jgi:uncharacterized protein YecT (DUF1311 family)